MPARTVVKDHSFCFVFREGNNNRTPLCLRGMAVGLVASPVDVSQVTPSRGTPKSPAPRRRATKAK